MKRSETIWGSALAIGLGLNACLACATEFSSREGAAGRAGAAGSGGRSGAAGSGGRAGEGGLAGTAGRNDGGTPANAGGGTGGAQTTAGTGGTTNEPQAGAAGEGSSTDEYGSLVLQAEPLVYWRMGITRGRSVPDETGGGNDLVLQGGGHELGVDPAVRGGDGAIRFDGAASFAIATNARALDFPDAAPFTLECWARRLTGGASYFQYLLSSMQGTAGNRDGYMLYLLPSPSLLDTAQSAFEYDLSGSDTGLFGPLPAEDNWAHYAAVFDGSSAMLYIDGTLVDSATIDAAFGPRNVPFAVARAASEETGYFSGSLDELAIYPRALNVGEIAAHADFRSSP
jgi:hypothetical protein